MCDSTQLITTLEERCPLCSVITFMLHFYFSRNTDHKYIGGRISSFLMATEA